jgi:hypothetical protein
MHPPYRETHAAFFCLSEDDFAVGGVTVMIYSHGYGLLLPPTANRVTFPYVRSVQSVRTALARASQPSLRSAARNWTVQELEFPRYGSAR